MEIRDWCIVVLAIATVLLGIKGMFQDVDMRNLERKQCKLEQYCNIIIEENKTLQRVNEQNLSIMAEGGWNDFYSPISSD